MRYPLLIALLALAGCGRTPPGWITSSGADGAMSAGTIGIDSGDDIPGLTGPNPMTADGTATSGTTSRGTTSTSTSTTGGSSSSDSTGPLSCIDSPDLCAVQVTLRRAVDILFVVDNSGSMGGEQGTLAENFASFIQVLEDQEVGANYRIGVTTTAGDGNLRATSCRSRLNEFIFNWQFGTIDEQQQGCIDNCDFINIPIPDPWVEKSDGMTNLPPGVSMIQALQCIGPQGINGPGLERHLESMRNTLVEDTQNFLRDDALLAVIFVTDEADCSMDDATQVWIQNFGEVFWTTPEGSTSGVCWNAGVSCTGGPGTYDDCVAQDKGQDGLPTMDPDEAVLYPLQRYIDALTDIAEQKQIEGGQGEVLVAVLGGVPLDYPDTGVVVYADSPFPEFQEQFGIGPGCGGGMETIQDPPGIPPVRLKEFAEAFSTGENNIFSICSDDYSPALAQIADAIGEVNERACINGCVTDADPGTIALEPDCSLVETFGDGSPDAVVPPCLIFDDGWEFPSDMVNTCFRAMTDVDGSTVTAFDDMSAQCLTVGSNVEFRLERRTGVPIPAGTSVDVNCNLDEPVGVTCEEAKK